jgi:hypothetical protein
VLGWHGRQVPVWNAHRLTEENAVAEPIGVELMPDQLVLVHVGDQVVAACARHGRGWSSVVRGQQYETTSLDAVINLIQARTGREGSR